MTQGGGDALTAVLALTGEVDTDAVPAFRAQARRLLNAEGVERLIIDLGQVSFIDSSGIGLLVTLHAECARGGIDLVLTRPTAGTRTLLEMTGVWDLVHIDDDARP
jgi:anti-anti-sigma factor